MLNYYAGRFAATAIILTGLLAGCSSGGGGGTPAGPITVSDRLLSSDTTYVLPQDNLTRFARAYTFTASSSGPATVTLASTDFVPVLAVFIGTLPNFNVDTVPPGFQLSANANSSAEVGTFNAVAGDQYFAVVSSLEQTGTGAFTLTFSPNLTAIQHGQIPPAASRSKSH